MRIKKITYKVRRDFFADMECEHCGHVEKLTSGYDDTYYHTQVIPAMQCAVCKKNRAGEIEDKP